MKKLNSKGFTALEVILLLIIIGLLVGAGLYVREKSQNKKINTPASGQNSNQVQINEPETRPSGRIKSAHQAFSVVIPGGWGVDVYDKSDIISSGGSCVNNSCIGGFVDAPDKPIVLIRTNKSEIDFYAVRFAVFTEDKFVQKFTNEQAEKSEFGPVDGVMGVKYHQVIPKTKEYQEGKEGHEIYEYSFTKDGKTYHVYYDIYGEGEPNKIDMIETVVRSLEFN